MRLCPILLDKPTSGKHDGEKSCTLDFTQLALAKGKLVFISYLLCHHLASVTIQILGVKKYNFCVDLKKFKP